MKKWILAVAALLVVEAILVWQVRRTERPPEPLLAPETQTVQAPAPAKTARPVRRHAQSVIRLLPSGASRQGDETPRKLDPKSDEFFERIDEVYPKHLYANAARCFRGQITGKNKNDNANFAFKIRVLSGRVEVVEAKLLESNLKDKSLERCFLNEIRASRWQDDEMPDYEQEDELLIRFRGLKKYIQPDDDDAIPTSNATNQ